MSLIVEARNRNSSEPRLSVWDDVEFQTRKGKKLAEMFKYSVKFGVPLEYPPILPAIRVPQSRPSDSWLRVSSVVITDHEHPFTKSFTDELKVANVQQLVDLPSGEIDFLYLSGGTIELQPIGAHYDYYEREIDGQTDGVLLPAVRVVFNPQLI